ERIVRAVERLIRNYEVLFPGVYSDNKEHLKKCKSWIIQNFESFITGEHLNRRIPGQLSYSNYSLHQEQALMVAYQERPSISQLLNMVAAVSVGVGLTIVARNASTYGWWSNVKDLFVASGFSTENLNVRFVDTAQLKLAIKEPLLSSVLVDGGHEQLQEVLEMIFDGKPNELRPKQVLSALDAPRVTDFKRYLGQFIWIRSFAVNTMRHGAPLDLRFD
ncbi:MAG: hypothetical protein HN623_02030, partial [Bdellovibrionales bacterium]|nr:hypothetical protein [Bdellovibrionales bacterium]